MITNSFTVTVDDGATSGPFAAAVGFVTADFSATGRLVRVDMESTNVGDAGVIEIEILGR